MAVTFVAALPIAGRLGGDKNSPGSAVFSFDAAARVEQFFALHREVR
jgi:hypothetical protein